MPKPILTGIEDIDARLAELENAAGNRIARAALRRASTVFAQHVRKAITAHPLVSKQMKQRLRALLGQAREKSPGGTAGRKVGFGVGRKRKVGVKRSGLNSTGVGISGANVHWALAGTDERFVGKTNARKSRGRRRTRKSKLTGNRIRPAGRMPQIDVITRAHYRGGSDAALAAIRETALRQLDRLVEKLNES
ncbi:MAG: hypothetical protein ACYTGL_13855 [Planctomycetota bacterium]|jgi:hypothetical protein